ncbi:tetratricopeptide repeat protein [bacterium]|nr:tetratricopeptide repeat protein [bacterium]
MKRWLMVLVWLLALGGLALADGPMTTTPSEAAALLAIESKKYVHLRELAQKMLNDEATKDLFSTYYFMGYVLHHAEGDLPRSHWYLEQAMLKFEKKYGNPPSYSAPWGWMEKIILEQAMVTGEMDLYEEQIKTWDRLDKLWSHYGRHLSAIQAFYSWPLMKLGREQEAREKLRMALRDGESEFAVTQVLNSLGALEMETDHLQAGARAFGKLLESVDRNGWEMTVTYYRNAGEAAACLLEFDEAERLFLKSTEYFDPGAFSNPWWDLATLYLGQGRYAEAVSSLKKCHQWTFKSEPFLAQQSWAANQQLTCEIFLQLGMTEEAYKIAQGFVERPDRKGGDSVQRDQWAAANMIVFREAANARRHAIQEQMVWTKGKAWWKLLWEQRDLAWQAYLKGQQAASSLVAHGRTLSCLRYAYAPGTVLIPNYVRLELATLLGPGTTLAALDQLEAKKFETLELERPYLNAIRFEALARAGRRQEALGRLEQVLKDLPASEVLLRTRVVARAAKLHLAAGDQKSALPLIQEVMEKSPCFMRNLQIPLPVSFASDGSAVAEAVIGMCRRSPRFSEVDGAFRVEVNKSSARLLGPDKSVLSQTEMEPLKKGEEAAPKLAEALHDRFFAAPIDLSQLDVGSLDGVVTGAVQSKEMQEMFFPGSTKPQNP